MRKLPFTLFHVTVSVYVVVFVFHLILGLPVMRNYAWIVYGLIGFAFVSSFHLKRWLPLLTWVVYLLLPFPGTVLLGYLTFANTYMSSPPDNETIETFDQAGREPFLIHISDPHFLGPGEVQTKEHRLRDPAILTKLVGQIVRLHPHYLLITGDVTDAGEETQWARASETLLKPAREAGITVITVPGNHDLQPAFFGVRGAGSPERGGAILARRFLENTVTLGADLSSADRGPLSPLVNWRPTLDEVNEEARKVYDTCIKNPPDFQTPPLAWAKGCELASQPEAVRDTLITFQTARACQDWFPLVRYDSESHTSAIVLCSIASVTPSIGDNAIGSFGKGQLKRLSTVLDGSPDDVKHVLIMLHHPVLRRWGDTYSVPNRWWRWRDWEDGSLYNYALLNAEWREANQVVDAILKGMKNRPQATFTLLYGHRHERSLSAILAGSSALTLSEAPAFGEGSDLGFRACYVVDGATRLACKWLGF